MKNLNVGDTVWVVTDKRCDSGCIISVNKNSYDVKFHKDSIVECVPESECYEYRTRIDQDYKHYEEAIEFVNRRFSNPGCKEMFKDNSFYFTKLLTFRFPNLEIIYVKNKDYFVLNCGRLYFDVFGMYPISKEDNIINYTYAYVNDRDFKDCVTNIHIM